MIIKNLDIDDPSYWINGVGFSRSQDILIRNCKFEFPYAFHKTAINAADSKFFVDSVEVYGGGVSVGLSGDQNQEYNKTTGYIINSKFYNNVDGILATYCDSFRIANNYFYNSGFTTDPIKEGEVRWLTIEGNEFYDGVHSIFFKGGSESVVSNNVVKNNIGGIYLDASQGCDPGSVKECFYTTDVLVANNIALGNDIDLYHCAGCTSNTWVGNIYETSQGAELIVGEPITAKGGFSFVDTVAANIAADAQLISIFSGESDTLGHTYKWIYIYKSTGQQSNYEFWYQNEKGIARGPVTDPVYDNYFPITETWIDSDSAITLANVQGGTEFIKTNGLNIITMKLMQDQGGGIFWNITYLAPEAMLTKIIDAKMN